MSWVSKRDFFWLTSKFNIQINQENLETKQQNVRFSDNEANWDYEIPSMPDDTFRIADSDDASLGNFFSRPIKIASYTWPIEQTFFETFNPWTLFFENPRVINRITNFNLLRAKLKVKIVLNGNSFHYGRAIASYTPLHTLDNLTVDRAFFLEDVVAASQRPHIYLDPTHSQGGTLTLPFFWYNNALSIPDAEWTQMGDMHIHGIQQLKHANGATDNVTVSVFAWAEDVSLSIPTANEPGALTPQSSLKKIDEYADGPISQPANVIQSIAGKLENVPGVGPYAMATKLAAGAVGAIARVFGYSRPTSVSPISEYKPVYLGNIATTNLPDTSQKLTLDAKQELTIDPRVVGLGQTDEMTICSVACRESYLTSFAWNVSSTPESLLWTSRVTPMTFAKNGDEFHFPACAFATLPFFKWRGSMKFRFQIVASAFHKGRMKLVYDPSYPLSNEYNTNYTHVIDLAKERDFTLTVGWGQAQSILDAGVIFGASTPPYQTVPFGSALPQSTNGILSAYVVNDLTVPNSTVNNDIQVNVFVSMGDDFEVFEPYGGTINGLSIFPDLTVVSQGSPPLVAQSATSVHPDAAETKEENAPMSADTVAPIADILPQDATNAVFFGDPITSFRQVLKRYNFHSAMNPGSANKGRLYVHKNDFPWFRGYDPNGVDRTSTDIPYNYSKFTLLNYLSTAYTARRGGIRWKYFRYGDMGEDKQFIVARNPFNTDFTRQFINAPDADSDRSFYADFYARTTPSTLNGAVTTSVTNNPVLEAEMPFYNNVRFSATKLSSVNDVNFMWTSHEIIADFDETGNSSAGIASYVSTAEDFTLYFFTGAPIMYFVGDPPPPPE